MNTKTILFHFLAIMTVAVWGVTFVSTKILITGGLSPQAIFFYRFLMAYVVMLAICHRRIFSASLRDEALLCLAGMCGGSVYFVAENTALGLTMASNVSLLICMAPVFTLILSRVFNGTRMKAHVAGGSSIALAGVAFVVFAGAASVDVRPAGDLLTLVAAMVWAAYCMLVRNLGERYPSMFITRKVFFYGVVTVIVYFLFRPVEIDLGLLSQPKIYGNLLFLGILASLVCYLTWNIVIKNLGATTAANYIYLIPLVTFTASAYFLSERLTAMTLAGAACIIGGVYIAERGLPHLIPRRR